MNHDRDRDEYFWGLIDRDGPLPDPATGVKSRCWLWLGSVTDEGYGRFTYDGIRYQVRRYGWELRTGENPGKLIITVKCGNRTCLRHLSIQTRTVVMAATVEKLRRQGTPTRAKLKPAQVLLIRRLSAGGKFTLGELAGRFKVSTPTIQRIVARRGWQHL